MRTRARTPRRPGRTAHFRRGTAARTRARGRRAHENLPVYPCGEAERTVMHAWPVRGPGGGSRARRGRASRVTRGSSSRAQSSHRQPRDRTEMSVHPVDPADPHCVEDAPPRRATFEYKGNALLSPGVQEALSKLGPYAHARSYPGGCDLASLETVGTRGCVILVAHVQVHTGKQVGA